MLKPTGISSQFLLSAIALLLASTSRADYLLGPNDVVRIAVYGNEDLTTETRISDSGKITFPLLGESDVGGLSVGEAETLVENLLSERGYVRNPQVNITVHEYRTHEVAVLDFVNKPGRYALDTASTVTQLIAFAGGGNPQGTTGPSSHECETDFARHPDRRRRCHMPRTTNIFGSPSRSAISVHHSWA